jgi:hypothetical protein
MNKRNLLIICFFCSINLFGQKIQDTATYKNTAIETSSTKTRLNIPDTLQVMVNSEKIGKKSFLENNIPWFVALFIGVLSAGVNFWISRNLRESNKANLLAQIENAKEITSTQYKATIASRNRQEWMNSLRDTLAEYLSSVSLIVPLNPYLPTQELEKRRNYIDGMALAKAKIELLTNNEKPEHKVLLDEVEGMLNVIINNENKFTYIEEIKKARSNVIQAAGVIFKMQWEKIKALE